MVQSQALEEYPVICEYCGEEAQPSLDLTWAWGPEVRKQVPIRKQMTQIHTRRTADLLASYFVFVLDAILLLRPVGAAVYDAGDAETGDGEDICPEDSFSIITEGHDRRAFLKRAGDGGSQQVCHGFTEET